MPGPGSKRDGPGDRHRVPPAAARTQPGLTVGHPQPGRAETTRAPTGTPVNLICASHTIRATATPAVQIGGYVRRLDRGSITLRDENEVGQAVPLRISRGLISTSQSHDRERPMPIVNLIEGQSPRERTADKSEHPE